MRRRVLRADREHHIGGVEPGSGPNRQLPHATYPHTMPHVPTKVSRVMLSRVRFLYRKR